MSLGNFEVLGKVGEGAYSQVFRVRRIRDGCIYALKKVKFLTLNEKEKQNALNEVRLLASVHHPNVISYKEAFFEESSGSLWYCALSLITEYADGGDLYQRILEYQKRGRYMSESFLWMLAVQLSQALAALHALSVLHRDIKSANVFLCSDGKVKLGDMNVSKVAKAGLLRTQTGTPYYASPEVWKDLPYDHKSDVWSLGCVLYEAAALKPPFRAEDMQGLFRKVVKGEFQHLPRSFSSDLQSLIESLLQSDPAKRPTCEEILRMPQIERRLGKLEELLLAKRYSSSTLLETIKFPRSFQYLSERLPAPHYDDLRNQSEPRPLAEEVVLPRLAGERRDESAPHPRFSRKLSTEQSRPRDRSENSSRDIKQILKCNYHYGPVKPRKVYSGSTPLRTEEASGHELSLDAIRSRMPRHFGSNGRLLSQRQDSHRLRVLKLLDPGRVPE